MSEAETHWTLFLKPEKHALFGTSKLDRSAQKRPNEHLAPKPTCRFWAEVPSRALGTKGYSTKGNLAPKRAVRAEHYETFIWILSRRRSPIPSPRVVFAQKSSRRRVRRILFEAKPREANFARAREYGINRVLAGFCLRAKAHSAFRRGAAKPFF